MFNFINKLLGRTAKTNYRGSHREPSMFTSLTRSLDRN